MLPKRYRGIVGKKMHKYVYLHRKYVDLVYPELLDFLSYYNDINYNLIKVKNDLSEIFLINCLGFDNVTEPEVGTVTKINRTDRKILSIKNYDHVVYHHKWLFVLDDYDGFNVQEAKTRSEKWLALNLKSQRIGNKNYWNQIIEKYNNFQ